MTHWEFSHLPFDGELTDNKIVCQNCGWSWNVKDGGDDLYVCHKCNTDNSKFYLDKEVFSNAVDPNLIIQGVSSLASVGGSIAQGKASKQMSKSDLQKEVETRCGKDKSNAWSKKKKNAFISCRDSVLKQLDTDKKISAQQKEKQQQLQQQSLIQNSKQERNQTYIIIGIIAVILGVVIYKKMNK
jgi:hypothetical protein